jgi:lipoprotein-anchoring transpeptidase ErfK/SrfK
MNIRACIHILALVAALAVLALGAGPARAAETPNIARVLAPTGAHIHPGSGRVVTTVGTHTPLSGGPTQLRIVETRAIGDRRYVRVLLPRRPNGTSAWISTAKVQLLRTRYRVRIDRGARRLVVQLGGHTIKSARIVVGAPHSPTPAGSFAISEEIRRSDPNDFVGAWVLPLTAFSGTYKQFDGGPGRVAIHGRGGESLADPLGTARSHGCVRVTNELVSWLAAHLQPGVPVNIR